MIHISIIYPEISEHVSAEEIAALRRHESEICSQIVALTNSDRSYRWERQMDVKHAPYFCLLQQSTNKEMISDRISYFENADPRDVLQKIAFDIAGG